MKISELRRKTKPELNKILQGLRSKLRQLRFKLASNKVKNVREINQIKKNIARIKTLARESELKEKPER